MSSIFVVLLLGTGLALGLVAYRSITQIVDSSNESVLKSGSKFAIAHTEAVFAPANTIVEQLANASAMRSRTLRGRLQAMPLLISGLELSENITSVYVGNEEGDFLLVRRLPKDPDLAKTFDPPDGTAYIVQSLERSEGGDAAGHFLFVDRKGRVIRFDERDDYTKYDPRKRGWYNAALGVDALIATDPYLFFTTREIGTTVARRGSYPEDLVTVVGADITLNTLGQAMAGIRPTPHSQIMLLTRNGEIVAHADPEKVVTIKADGSPAPRRIDTLDDPRIDGAFDRFVGQSQKAAAQNRFTEQGSEDVWEVAFESVPIRGGRDLVLAMTIPRSELRAESTRLVLQGVVLFIVLLIVGVILVIYIAGRVTQPLRQLQALAEAIRRFDFSKTDEVRTPIAEIEDLARATSMMQDTIRRFLEITSTVAAEEDFDKLLDRLLDEIIATTQTEAGILYLTTPDGKYLEAQAQRLDARRDLPVSVPSVALSNTDSLLIRSIADEHAESAQASELELNRIGLPDIAAVMDDAPSFLLAAPLYNRQGELVGVLLLFETTEMEPALVRFTEALSGSAAVTVEARQLIEMQKELFESFIQMTASAIDAKSPYTGGHCARVPDLTKLLAAAADKSTDGPFADFSLTEDDWEAIHVAAWLHDCGKVTTPEFVVDKATKLETIYDRIHEVRMRFEVMKRDAEIAYLKSVTESGGSDEKRSALEQELAQLDADFAFIASCNVGGEFMTDEQVSRLNDLAKKGWTRTIDDRLGVSHEELSRKEREPKKSLPAVEPLLADRLEHRFERPETEKLDCDNPWGFKMDVPELLYNRGELHNLLIRRGTLTDEDRYKINEHIVQTIKMLEKLPFPKHLRSVPELAGGHHEKMDGTGYPKGLTKDDMSPVARMMAIADIFEALTAMDRPYKKGKKLSEALKIMTFMVKDRHIDPDLFNLFLDARIYESYAEKYMPPEQVDAVNPDDYRVKVGG
ncbi:GAF domain-containing protein [Rhodospirillaceae bacterium KN72]|uniref:GAF domain-containing protein n=1 Tax=Pacificispira spongiicola TaxID=2729598 RepID=A0A7Y0DWZ3_9PROT|nr:HD domain-containing phosphohydrolase [Pacificispira spongiicola]NMM43137.1 GAF domain-containing protein [Pacificispira spongiicola]